MRSITVGTMFRETAARFPGRICVETESFSHTYAELDRFTDRVACALMDLGLEKGSRAGIWCKDSPEFLCLYLAMEKTGIVPVLLNTALGGAELNVLLRKADAQLLFFDDGYKGVQFPQVVEALGLRNARFIPDYLSALPELTPERETALRAAEELVRPEDPDAVIFTSGTSGAAKGVLTTHLARANVAFVQAETLSMTEEDKLCVAIPMYHCFCLTGVVLAALCCGASLYFPPERRTRYLLESVSLHKCTVLSAVPTLFSAMLSRSDLASFDLSSMRTGYIGGALYTPGFFRQVEEAFSCPMAPSLGQTEATAGLTFLPPEAPLRQRCSTVGRFMEGLEGEIRDIRTGQPLPRGDTGEICIRGYSVMLGYVNEPERTRETIDPQGWLRTGDLGWLDEDDCLHLAGRLKEIIIRGGENISPGEIEAQILADPRVREVKCVAVPDAHYGEEICACVVPQPGSAPIRGDELRELAGKHLAAYKVPRYVLFLESLPRTPSDKIALAALKKLAAERLGLAAQT